MVESVIREPRTLTFRERFFLIILSLILVAFGQPSWFPLLAPLASVLGYALFFQGIQVEGRATRFNFGLFWFFGVQLIQLSWMTAIEYQGFYILIAYLFFSLGLGVQFGLFTLCVPARQELTLPRVFALAGLWTLFEWSRLFFLSGFTWNPIGLAQCWALTPIQMASLTGVFGLSFWVMLQNMLSLRVMRLYFRGGGSGWSRLLQTPLRTKMATLAVVLFLPHLFGVLNIAYHSKDAETWEEKIHVALVQPGLLPSEKQPLEGRIHQFVPPIDQWERLLVLLKRDCKQAPELIALPEAAFPYPCEAMIYPIAELTQVFREQLGDRVIEKLPPLRYPYAAKRKIQGKEMWLASNAFAAQLLSNSLQAEVVIGLEGRDEQPRRSYNAAFHFVPGKSEALRYEKRVLLPLAEYLPFAWCMPFVRCYGITDFFTPGKEAKLFGEKMPFAVSICYEETFAGIIREGRMMGARFLLNLTNDYWFPFTRLPLQHFSLGRLRAIENGAPLMRACNTGVTSVIDSLGRVIAELDVLKTDDEHASGVLALSVPLYRYPTLYLIWGDTGILAVSMLCLLAPLVFTSRLRRKVKQK